MTAHKFHQAHIIDKNTNQTIKGYLEAIAMTPLHFKFNPKNGNLKPGDIVATDVMEYKVLTVKPVTPSRSMAVFMNKNII